MGLFNKKQQINAETPVETWQLTVFGIVQGVGFRYSVLQLAKQMNICGSVYNNSDQTVTITLQTSLDRVNQFCTELPQKISQFARISKIHKEKLTNIAKMSSFHVLY